MMVHGIHETLPAEHGLMPALYRAAFPQEDLGPLVTTLLAGNWPVLSLSAMIDQHLAGHVMFTLCQLEGSTDIVALLAPLAVHPDHQRQGIGTALARTGLERLKAQGVAEVVVLGDPAYYSRLGFRPAHFHPFCRFPAP